MGAQRRRLMTIALLALSAGAAYTARTAPPFTMLRPNQPSIRLSQYHGKVVVLAFILTTCGHCQQLTVELNQLARDYSARGVQIVECAFNEDAAQTMPDFQERFTPQFPVAYSAAAAVSVFLQRTMIDPRPLRVPYLVLIDRTGVIRAEFEGGSEFFQNPGTNLRAQLDKLLGRK
jgi:peroxiredoxin